MEPEILIPVVVVLVLVAVILAVVALRRQRQSKALHDRFGPEYDRTVERTGDRKDAEEELRGREERRARFDIRPLPPEARDRYADAWRDTQRRFVDTPQSAVHEAHGLVTDLMRERGYPMDEFEQRADDLSVDHPEVVEDYRAAHRIVAASTNGGTGTEDLRQAVVHFRALFDRLLDSSETSSDSDSGTEVR